MVVVQRLIDNQYFTKVERIPDLLRSNGEGGFLSQLQRG